MRRVEDCRLPDRAKKYCAGLLAILVACLGQGSAIAAEDTDGVTTAVIVTKVCAKCHGVDGNRMTTPETPKIGGQKADYLAHALHDYKNGARTHLIMAAVAQALDADTIKALARYFSEQESELHTPD